LVIGQYSDGRTTTPLPVALARRSDARRLLVRDANGQALAYLHSRDNGDEARQGKVLTKDEARRISRGCHLVRQIRSREASRRNKEKRRNERGEVVDMVAQGGDDLRSLLGATVFNPPQSARVKATPPRGAGRRPPLPGTSGSHA
jgi:hypothetical protein